MKLIKEGRYLTNFFFLNSLLRPYVMNVESRIIKIIIASSLGTEILPFFLWLNCLSCYIYEEYYPLNGFFNISIYKICCILAVKSIKL